ncbi:MAG: ArsR/SmtB family transcription factor [Thermoplasmatota archaeon]
MFAGSRGGYSRARIIQVLKETPMNTNQLAENLGLDYSTVQHHLTVLEENGLIYAIGPKYGRVWFLSPKMNETMDTFNSIWEKLDRKP